MMRKFFEFLGDVVGCAALVALFWVALIAAHVLTGQL